MNKIEKLLNDLNTMSVFHWIRLGICFGILRWTSFMSGIIIACRAAEKAMMIYQMGVLDRDEGTNILDSVGDIYVHSFIFESIIIWIGILVLWLLLFKYFGLPKKLFGKNPNGMSHHHLKEELEKYKEYLKTLE